MAVLPTRLDVQLGPLAFGRSPNRCPSRKPAALHYNWFTSGLQEVTDSCIFLSCIILNKRPKGGERMADDFVTVRVPASLHRQLKRASKSTGKTMSRCIEEAVIDFIDRWKREESIREYARSIQLHEDNERLLQEYVERMKKGL